MNRNSKEDIQEAITNAIWIAATIGYQETPGKQNKKRKWERREQKRKKWKVRKRKHTANRHCAHVVFYRHTNIHANVHTIRMLLHRWQQIFICILKELVNRQKDLRKIWQPPSKALKTNTNDLIETLQASFWPIEAIAKARKRKPLRPLKTHLRA